MMVLPTSPAFDGVVFLVLEGSVGLLFGMLVESWWAFGERMSVSWMYV
jgi:hypothetical protein